ncbi:hypothetical protein ES703_70863 [subsurface metagenome]
MQDSAIVAHGKDIGRGVPPDFLKGIAAYIGQAPGAAVIVDDSAIVSHGKDISQGATPDTPEVICCAAAHGTPASAVIMDDGATVAHGKDIP